MVNRSKLDHTMDIIGNFDLNVVGFEAGYPRSGAGDPAMQAKAVELAKQGDYVLLYIGLDEISESEGLDRGYMKLPQSQIDLLNAVYEVNKNIIVVMSAGSSVEISYTTFEYSDLAVSDKEASFTIKNTGEVDGAEVAQLYVSAKNPTIYRPVKELKGFAKVFLRAGESQKVTIHLDDKAFRRAVCSSIVTTVVTGGVSMVIIFPVDKKIFAPGFGEKKN